MSQKIALQEAGLGVGWLPRSLIRHQLASGQLVALTTDAQRDPIQLHIAKHSEDRGKALTWFWDTLSQPDYFSDWLADPE